MIGLPLGLERELYVLLIIVIKQLVSSMLVMTLKIEAFNWFLITKLEGVEFILELTI